LALSSGTHQQFTVTPRDASTSFEETQETLRMVLSATPGARMIDLDPKNRIAIIEVPDHLEAAVRAVLGHRFIVDPNAPLRY
jgi:hypothetical protein